MAMYDAFEYLTANGFEWVAPEDIGALTSAPILKYDNKYWWYPNYAVRSPLEDIAETGKTVFTFAPEEKTASLKLADLDLNSLEKRWALYVDGKLAIRTLTRSKAERIAKEKFPQQVAAGKYEIKREDHIPVEASQDEKSSHSKECQKANPQDIYGGCICGRENEEKHEKQSSLESDKEVAFEKAVDHLDKKLMNGTISQSDYDLKYWELRKQMFPKEASLNKQAIHVTVEEKLFVVNPLQKTADNEYVYDVNLADGSKLFKITSKDEMGQEHLSYVIEKELTKEASFENPKSYENYCACKHLAGEHKPHGEGACQFDRSKCECNKFKKYSKKSSLAKLTSNLAFLKKGSFVSIVAEDKVKGQVKFASLDNSLRGWAPQSKFAAFGDIEQKFMEHEGHKDEVFAESGNELLVACPAGSTNVTWRAIEAPPATPESLNDLEAASTFKPGMQFRISGGSGVDSDKIVTIVPSSAVETDGRGVPTNVSGAYKPVDWSREVAFQYEDGSIGTMFKNRLFPVANDVTAKAEFPGGQCAGCGKDIPTVWGETYCKECVDKGLDKKHFEKKAAGCDQCEMLSINGIPTHETGCPNAPRKCRHGKMSDSCSVCSDPFEGEGAELEASLNKNAHIRHEDGKWVIYSHDYKKKLGTYDSKEAAEKRLKQIEYFKHQGSMQPLSKKEAVQKEALENQPCDESGCNEPAVQYGHGGVWCAKHKKSSEKEAAGEADQDYDPKPFDEIVKGLAAAGYKASHREFDKYQGVYIQVSGKDINEKFWVTDGFYTGKRSDDVSKYKYRKTRLVDEEGNEFSANAGDYWNLDPNKKLEGLTLIRTLMDGTEERISNPTKADLVEETGEGSATMPDSFTYQKGTEQYHLILTPQSDEAINIEYIEGSNDVSELVDYLNSKSKVRTSSLKKSAEDTSLEQQVQGFKDRMNAVTERLSNPPVKQASEIEDTSKGEDTITTSELIESLERGIDLLEGKTSDQLSPEEHHNLEEMENLLWKVEDSLGLSHPLPEHEIEEPEHAEEAKVREPEFKEPEAPVEKESDQSNVPPATPAPRGFRYAFEPTSQAWVLVADPNATGIGTGGA
jgi:hypothetical protein